MRSYSPGTMEERKKSTATESAVATAKDHKKSKSRELVKALKHMTAEASSR